MIRVRRNVLIDEAVKAAKDADVVVAAVGESRGMSHESSSRTDINIPANQRELIKRLESHRQTAGAGVDERPSAVDSRRERTG